MAGAALTAPPLALGNREVSRCAPTIPNPSPLGAEFGNSSHVSNAANLFLFLKIDGDRSAFVRVGVSGVGMTRGLDASEFVANSALRSLVSLDAAKTLPNIAPSSVITHPSVLMLEASSSNASTAAGALLSRRPKSGQRTIAPSAVASKDPSVKLPSEHGAAEIGR